MNKYNPNIHHRRSIRLKGYDYSKVGLYFITICVQNRECLFGEIIVVDDVGVENFQPQLHQPRQEMILNDAGKFVDQCWLDIPKHFPNAVLHEYIVMPNHVHGIVELQKNDVIGVVGVENFQPLPPPNTMLPNEHPQNEFQKMIPRSIGSIVKGFKIGVTKWFHDNTDIEKVWHRNYWEHIIRDEKSYQHISKYIMDNPKKWKDDEFYKK